MIRALEQINCRRAIARHGVALPQRALHLAYHRRTVNDTFEKKHAFTFDSTHHSRKAQRGKFQIFYIRQMSSMFPEAL